MKTTILTVMKKLKNFIYGAWRCKVLTAYRIKHLNMSAFRMIKNLSWNLRTCLFHRKGLDTSKMLFIDRVQNGKHVSRFCLDHSRARNAGVIRKQFKQTCRTKQRNEKWLKHKVSGYKSQSKRRSIAGCRLLLRTLQFIWVKLRHENLKSIKKCTEHCKMKGIKTKIPKAGYGHRVMLKPTKDKIIQI